MGDKKIGGDLSKWYINRHGSQWVVCPPVNHDDPLWYTHGGVFPTGAEAFVAFAAGADLAHMAARTAAVSDVEPWHGKAVTA